MVSQPAHAPRYPFRVPCRCRRLPPAMPVAVGCKRELPFLQRNLARGLKTSRDMGNVASVARNLAGDSCHEPLGPGGRELRPHKRRRVDSPADEAMLIANAKANAKSNAMVPLLEDQLFVATDVGPVQRTLRVDVLRIVHKDLLRVRVGNGLAAPFVGPRVISESRARCKIMLTHATTAGDIMLHCQSQMCTVRSSRSAADPFPTIRIHLNRAFFIPEDSIFVNRPDNHLFDLADAYKVSIELEAAGPGEWPPLGLVPSAADATTPAPRPGTNYRNWVLAGELSDLFSKKRSMVDLKLRKSPVRLTPTDYLIDIDAGWSTGFDAGGMKPLEKAVESSIRAEGTPPRALTRPRGVDDDVAMQRPGSVNGVHNIEIPDDDDDEPDGEGTPNRSLRTRGNKQNYNLKDLSDKALGRNKKRRKRKSLPTVGDETGKVCYDLPAEQVNLEDFQCITCGQSHMTLADLQAHLEHRHPEYDYVCDPHAKSIHFQVVHRIEAFSFDEDGTYELKKTVKGFQFGQNSNSDESWLKSTFGLPKSSELAETHVKNSPANGPSSDVIKRKGKVITVPYTKQQLFDPVSRMPLEPGKPFIRHKPDDRWLTQWHRDAIEDFSDIPFHEREFMTTWDEFMLTQRISSDVYLPSSWLAFLRHKAEWLVCSESRMIEFGKHISYLIARDALNDQTIKQGFQIISAAKLALQNSGARMQQHASPVESPPRKSAANCQTCARQILGPRLLLCANPDCKKPAFHRDCVKRDARMDVEDPAWLCNVCIDIPAEQQI
ncbi:hypothetical protein HYQ44_000334 [Verticillium longisporum]|nr:hypothetical protein HYQ44_000334 [Verticillium longisporum]